MDEMNIDPELHDDDPGIRSRIDLVPLILSGCLVLLGLICFILTNAFKFLGFAVLCVINVIWHALSPVRRKKELFARILVLMIIIFFTVSSYPLMVTSSAKWQYPFQRVYLNEPEWFPDFLDDVTGNYHFESLASVMQGTGHYTVYFRTSPERAAEYAEEYAAKAQYAVPLNEYYDRYRLVDMEPDGAVDGSLDVYISGNLWGEYYGSDTKAMIYITDTNLNWNHPHSKAVIVDAETGKIQISQVG